jgi:hypothetical protein
LGISSPLQPISSPVSTLGTVMSVLPPLGIEGCLEVEKIAGSVGDGREGLPWWDSHLQLESTVGQELEEAGIVSSSLSFVTHCGSWAGQVSRPCPWLLALTTVGSPQASVGSQFEDGAVRSPVPWP